MRIRAIALFLFGVQLSLVNGVAIAASQLDAVKCDGKKDLAILIDDFNNSDSAKEEGLKIIDVQNVSTVERTEKSLECYGRFIDANRGFEFYVYWTNFINVSGQIWTHFELKRRR